MVIPYIILESILSDFRFVCGVYLNVLITTLRPVAN